MLEQSRAPFTLPGALTVLRNGYGTVPVEDAKEICELFEVRWADALIFSWNDQQEAMSRLSLQVPLHSTEGVATVALSYHLCRELKITIYTQDGLNNQAASNCQALFGYCQAREWFAL